VDWPTLLFQIINFLILVWLLKRFLYGRIIRAMDERQARIAAQLEEAEKKKAEAEKLADELRKKNEELDATREQLLAEMRQQVEAERKSLLAKTREEVERTRHQWLDSLQREKDSLLADIRQRVLHETCAITRRALADMASAQLERQLAEAFATRLETLPDDQLQALRPGGDGKLVLRSAFDLPDDLRGRLADLVRRRFGEGVNLQFETSPQPICGLELTSGSQKLAWSLDSYLDDLEEKLRQALESLPASEKTEPEPEGEK